MGNDLSPSPQRKRLIGWSTLLVLLAVAAPRLHRENFFSEGGELEQPIPLPAFAATMPLPDTPEAQASPWIGIEPLSRESMRGRVWVLKLWTFGCVNCIRAIPYANGLMTRFDGEVGVLGIHSPEFDWERDRTALSSTLREWDVRFPTYVDSSLQYFMALEAPAWPTYYVVDKAGNIRGRWVGEMHEGTRRARGMESLVERLLDESGVPPE